MIVGVIINVRSMGNVGSIFRTADGAGINKLYLAGLTPLPFDVFGAPRPQIQKTSLGAEKWVPWEQARSAPPLLKRLKKEGYKIIALERASGSVAYDKIKIKRRDKIAIVVGGEVRGLSHSILKLADHIAEIPMRGKKESLNVSVAFGIAAYALKL
jgi:tRNA G18 (ribose-2'-O)-methylase SpoU